MILTSRPERYSGAPQSPITKNHDSLNASQAWANFTYAVFRKYRGTLSEAAIFVRASLAQYRYLLNRICSIMSPARQHSTVWTFPQVSSLSTDAIRRLQHELVPATKLDQRIFVSHDSQFSI